MGIENLQTSSNVTKCIIFFGGSIVFGHLDGNETLPYYVSKRIMVEGKSSIMF